MENTLNISTAEYYKNLKKKHVRKEQLSLNTLMIPCLLLGFIFFIAPMFGVIIAFLDYTPTKGFFGSQFVDVYNFSILFNRPDFGQSLVNTVSIALIKIVLITLLAIVFTLLINEIQNATLKKVIQVTIFLPYFLSWALIGNVFVEMFSLTGTINHFLSYFGIEGKYWITDETYFRGIIILTDVWKTLGYQVVIFLAAITTIDSKLYEAARIDGANELQLCFKITIPSIMPMIILMSILNFGNIMNAGFEQILVMYNPSVYSTGDILDTMSYRVGILAGDYSIGTAIGLFKSVISCICFSSAYYVAYKMFDHRIF